MYIRDLAGLTFVQRGRILREVNRSHADHYDHLMESGLYQHLVKNRMLVSHAERGLKYALTDDAYRVIHPKTVLLESYPYEWSFSQWQAAALLVLDVTQAALAHNMMLRDASVYSVQFQEGTPLWTDTLAFTLYHEGQAWAPYLQFVGQYLAPLALMSKVDVTLGHLLQIYPEGIPLSLVSTMLPGRTRVNFGLTNHIHMNSRRTNRYLQRMTKEDIFELLDNLRQVIESLSWEADDDLWTAAEAANHITEGTLDQRQRFLRDAMGHTKANIVWDLSAGAGLFSKIAANEFGAFVAAFNDTPDMVELLWQHLDEREKRQILPLLMDWSNPSPGLGWANRERRSIGSRANADLLVGMNLVHRLAILSDATFPAMAAKFVRLAPALVIEFVPGNDPQLITLLESGQSVIPDHKRENFEAAFTEHYDIVMSETVPKTDRQMYLLQRQEKP